jgi:hypothetical protein
VGAEGLRGRRPLGHRLRPERVRRRANRTSFIHHGTGGAQACKANVYFTRRDRLSQAGSESTHLDFPVALRLLTLFALTQTLHVVAFYGAVTWIHASAEHIYVFTMFQTYVPRQRPASRRNLFLHFGRLAACVRRRRYAKGGAFPDLVSCRTLPLPPSPRCPSGAQDRQARYDRRNHRLVASVGRNEYE